MTEETPEVLTTAVRVWAPRTTAKGTSSKQSKKPSRPKATTTAAKQRPLYTIVFDTETTIDPTQRLNFGVYRIFVDERGGIRGTRCVQEGILFADDLPERDPVGFGILEDYVATRRADVAPGRSRDLRLRSRTDFCDEILFKWGYEKGALIVGFNLPFDLSRIAIDSTPARGRFFGGVSLQLFAKDRFRPRLVIKALDSKRSLMQFTRFHRADETQHQASKGQILDLRTLSFALTDKPGSLEKATSQFGVPYTKREVVHGAITSDYVDYCREDVAATAELLVATLAEFDRHPIELDPTRAFSPASIGKSYLRAMGIQPILERQPDFDPVVLGKAMGAYFGGRAECRIRKTWVPVILTDFLSMYPTVNALMGTWRLIVADRIDTVDVTDDVRRLLSSQTLAEDCLSKDFWQQLICLVELTPMSDTLPVRAEYDSASKTLGIGVNPFTSETPCAYTLADVVASVLLNGTVPNIHRATRFVAVGRQDGLRPIGIRGSVSVDPVDGDLFRQIIELRKTCGNDESLSEEEQTRLPAFLKVLANSTGYGIYAEMNPDESSATNIPVTVHDASGSAFITTVDAPEDPGTFCFPPLAAVITGAARLMLALLQHEVATQGGSYAFCDTDSMAIVATRDGGLVECPGGSQSLPSGKEAVLALSFAQVSDIIERFSSLNPYDPSKVSGSILEIEKESLDAEGNPRAIGCYSISAKRYCLARIEEGTELGGSFAPSPDELLKPSEHGLGHLLNPMDPELTSSDWIREVWAFLLGDRRNEPAWLDRPALTRVTASSSTVLRWFDGMNEGLNYQDRIKPANFLLIAHPNNLEGQSLGPVAAYEGDAFKWEQMTWLDRNTGATIRIATEPFDGMVRPGVAQVLTCREVLNRFWTHPEAKSLGPNGEKVRRTTLGRLKPRPVKPLRTDGSSARRVTSSKSASSVCWTNQMRSSWSMSIRTHGGSIS